MGSAYKACGEELAAPIFDSIHYPLTKPALVGHPTFIVYKGLRRWLALEAADGAYERFPEPKTRAAMRTDLLRFNGTVERDPAIDAWMKEHAGELGAIALRWFEMMRNCGDEVREVLHDGCPTACLGDVPFGYVNAFTSHVNVGFFHGAALPDPARLLEGNGKFMRHVKLRPGEPTDERALTAFITAAWVDIKARVEHG